MVPSFIPTTILSIFLCGAMTSGCVFVGSQPQAKFKETRNAVETHVAGSGLSVATQNGSVTVQRIDGSEVKIEATVRCISQERLDATKVISERKDGKLTIGVAWAEGRPQNNEGCELKISVPDATGVNIQTGNGAINITGLGGAAVLNSSNGTIVAKDHDGDVVATTSNGRVSLVNVSGKLNAHTSNGSIDIEGARAPIVAVTSNGSIDAALADECAGPVKLDSSNANVSLTIGKAFAGKLTASTSNGGVDLAQLPGATVISAGRTSASLAFGDSPAVSDIATSNGSIKIRAAKAQ